MIAEIPTWIEALFLVVCFLTIGLFYFANGKSKKVVSLILLWSLIHSFLAYFGFYNNTDQSVPRFGLVLIPSFIIILYGLLPKQMEWVIKHRNTNISTFLHSIRFPVEMVLFQLFIYEMVPKLMTFEGRNYDIIIGLTAPLIGYLYIRNKLNEKALIVWNSIGLCFIIFILINGVLSAELPFQQFAFDQPNKAVNYFPFILLPATIVPIVIWTHLSDILKLIKELKNTAITK
jgi:hypothetical protein